MYEPKEKSVFQLGKEAFKNHMKEKVKSWNPWRVFIGDNFTVFYFEFKYQMENAKGGALLWLDSYNYSLLSDMDSKFVIINKT